MRLIDVDLYCATICKCNRRECDKAKCPIHNAPTAYDIDKVVDELEKASKDVSRGYLGKDNNKYHKHYKAVRLSRAIEIVKQGGVSDDVCEWHKVKNGNAYKCNTHAEIHDSRVLDWCKCPYCGKKIKIVGD